MEIERPNAATRAQIAAADPKGSVWLAANAGSGKTRVLTNRVAWLLLEGAAPERILCLTFTRAAAAEMQNRLSETLGEWAMLPDDDLRQELTKLGVERGRIDSDRLQRARTLFARAIETPGGLKIQTIHAFCASLLRRFPMEAGITPAFREMDDIAQRRLLNDVLDAMAEDSNDAPRVEELAGKLSASTPDAFLAGLAGRRDRLGKPANETALRTALGVAGESREQLREWAIDGDALDVIERMRDAAAQDKTATATKLTASLSEAILADADRRFDLIRAALLTGKGEPRKKPLTKTALQAFGGEDALGDIEVLVEAILATDDALRGFDALDRARLLHDFAPRFLDRLAREKSARGWLDYDDLVLRARDLLSVRETAQWVLYKLDGGIDHVLVDEAQDTSQVQWDVIEALTGEFGAGDGARDAHRTLFVVGDRKQSIFSFQGADPVAFDAMRDRLGHQLEGGAALTDHALLHSFRSAPSILRLVDRVFDQPSGAGDPTEHIAFNAEMPGRVDLWDHVPEPDAPEARDWTDPVDQPASDAAHVVLAQRIAATIDAAIKAGTPITHKGERRAMQARDVLILFRSRDKLFNATIAACKRAGLEMAGADRLRLDQELAVRDLLALCRFATTPEDDLSLAAVLRSPLGGLSESDLFTLAHGRKLPLWRQLRDHGGFDPVADMVEDVMRQADFLRPYELLQRILIRHDGRRKLLGRLGNPAAEAIDGLLQQALSFEALEVPSLTAFLGWVDEAEIEIKREATGGAIRVMSIHGSKGLEAPVVIVPQCGPWKPNDPSAFLAPDGETLVWRPSKPDCNEALLSAYEAAQQREAQERDRLLYVALTRAESWLICASAGTEEKDEETSWAGRLRTALVAEGAEPNGDALRLEEGDWSPMPIVEAPQTSEPELPPWANTPVPEQPVAERLLSPSDLGGAKALPGDDYGNDRDAALRHGSRVHALLEHLPSVAEADRAAIADHLIARHARLAPNESSTRAVAEALTTIAAHPAIFSTGTLAEVPFVLPASGGSPGLQGMMDRVIVTDGTVLIIDFKTNQAVPNRAEDTPEGLLRQLGAYRKAATAIWPGKTVETAILWTSSSQLMTVPHDLVTAAWLRATAH